MEPQTAAQDEFEESEDSDEEITFSDMSCGFDQTPGIW